MSSLKVSSKLNLKSLKATKVSTNLSGSCGGDTNQIANQAYVDESSSSSSYDDDDEWAIVPRYSRRKEEKEQRDRHEGDRGSDSEVRGVRLLRVHLGAARRHSHIFSR